MDADRRAGELMWAAHQLRQAIAQAERAADSAGHKFLPMAEAARGLADWLDERAEESKREERR
ncbi:MAG: hypothetical protein DLM67_03065 [Candidatus Nephthysia bennettiae]|uniref:Uncharacterized protein n=1 Tax=Candidatus Nephthysia bennettiae TaxID=3127016 RepID=A0A934K549_9BACT|nr:hypothetical protein [Candidatus Dormibacteraeota bacterium]PZR99767.1 MAG: hypothetical protein DLM67_03065 [Candidatus Dormibacteraeota bacterium]